MQMMFIACGALLLLFFLTSPDGIADEDQDFGVEGISRNGGRGWKESSDTLEDEGLRDNSLLRQQDGGPYYQEGLVQRLLKVHPTVLESPYLPSVKVSHCVLTN